jgi:hypothetical protein
MIYDFHGNFSEIYPIPKDSLKFPDRDKWGYYWDFEDYLIENETGRGLSIQGIFLSNPDDFRLFSDLFQRAFRMSTINAKLKNFHVVNFTDFIDSEEFESSYVKESVEVLSSEVDAKIERMNDLFEEIKNLIKRRNGVWISLCPYWTDLMHEETQKFWGDDVFVFRLPVEYSPMNFKSLWEELDILGGMKFDKDMMWEDFSYMYPEYVKYLDPRISKRIDTDFLGTSSEYGLL